MTEPLQLFDTRRYSAAAVTGRQILLTVNRAPTDAEIAWINESLKQSIAAFYELPVGDLTNAELEVRRSNECADVAQKEDSLGKSR